MATFRLHELFDAMDRRAEARGLLAEWIEANPGDVESLRMLRDMDIEDRNWEGVARTCAGLASVERDEAQIEAVLMVARAHTELGRPQDALPGLEKAHEENPDSGEIRGALRDLYEAAGVHDQLARILIEDATSADSTDEQVEMLRKAGEMLVASGQIGEAIPIFQDILELKPGDAFTTGALADAYIAAKQLGEADRILDASIEELSGRRSPELGAILYRKARVAEAAEDIEGQLRWLQEAFKMDRHSGRVAAELADLAELVEDWDLALQALRAIALIKTDCPVTLLQSLVRQGRISLKLGDTKRAVFFARKAKKEDPMDPEVIAFLADLGEE
jgi:tetratricopeptide (TPR) repeat protein